MIKKFKVNFFAFLGYGFLFLLGKSLRLKIIGEENLIKIQQQKKSCILITWHGLMYCAIYYLRNRNIYGIVSPSSDGEFFAKFFSNFGWQVLRGSSRRGGISALKNSLKILRENKILAVTPDGPIGPAFEVKEGIIYLASRTNVPIIPVAMVFNLKKIFNTWDKAQIPYPFSKAVLIFGDEIYIPENINTKQCEDYKSVVKNALNEAIKKAEADVKNNYEF